MGRLAPSGERWIAGLGLAGIAALAWFYLWHDAHSMTHRAPFAAMAAMWVVMMAGMMVPSVAPTVLLYGSMVRKNAERGTALAPVGVFVSGYLLAWGAFGVAAALVHALLDHGGWITPMMELASPRLAGALLVAAGVYQWTPLKDACLSRCRAPVQFLMTHWRPGRAGALRMGLAHGAYCVGCCWMLMLLLFAVGVMNLLWVAVLTAFILAEKLLPGGRTTSRIAGASLILLGAAALLTR